MSASPPVLAEAVAAALERILESQEFAQSWRLKALLRYLVNKTVRGEQGELKEYSIALAVFERAPSFDPKDDTIVRAQARRLRQILATYYHTPAGQSDPVRIEIPKGGYVPVFQVRASAQADGSAARKSAAWWRRRWIWAAVGAAAFLAVALVPVLRSLSLLPRPCVPDTWTLAGNRLTVLGARGNTCWETTFPPSEPHFDTMVLDRVVIADIDGDNRKEVLVNLCPQGPAPARGSLLCLEQSGCTECCRQKGFVYLAEADLARAAAFLRMTAAAFERRYVYRTRHRMRLRMPRHSLCQFLRPGGCSIHPAKPTQCRIFPFWPELLESRREWNQTARWCPGIGQGPLIQIEIARAQAQETREAYPAMY